MGAYVIALRGPVGAGKTLLAEKLSREPPKGLGYPYVETGMFFRAAAHFDQYGLERPPDYYEYMISNMTIEPGRILFKDPACATFMMRVIEFEKLRTPEIDTKVTSYSKRPEIQKAVLKRLTEMIDKANGGIILNRVREASDRAHAKIFLDALPEVRAHRSMVEGETLDYAMVRITERDKKDAAIGLLDSEGWYRIDTTDLNPKQVFREAVTFITVVAREEGFSIPGVRAY